MQKIFSQFFTLTKCRLKCLGVKYYSSSHRSSNSIRQQFLDFFIKENNHTFVKSSSVIPFCDPSLSFTNAGMNQFKNIFIGNQLPKYKRVANSQKCIRVGGKHNDLSIVGSDSYHHTFFEMLGNWSFGDYFKKEACEMAWKLLTEVYLIPKERLYVTYFKGDSLMGLKEDVECKEIWLQLGVDKNRIIGFGTDANFWEMASSGPCGRCTEIHLDHLPTYASVNRAAHVNGDLSDLTEIWNIVFIENFRKTDGSIESLKEKHIDTGMGFERLVAFLQEKDSNYDTDLFLPIIKKIETASKKPAYTGMFQGVNTKRDRSYRIMADHSRMVAVSLADGMFPEYNQKLRRIIRKCLLSSEKHFRHDNLLTETYPVVAEILGESYPELHKQMYNSLEIIRYEQELFTMLRESQSKGIRDLLEAQPHLLELQVYEYPNFVNAYHEFRRYKKSNSQVVSGEFAFYIHTSFGFDFDLIERLAELENMTVDCAGFEQRMNEMKKNVQSQFDEGMTATIDLPPTKNDAKFDYSYDATKQIFHTEPVESNIIAIFDGKKFIENTKETSESVVKIIFEESPFYFESGGQQADNGTINIGNNKYEIKSLAMQRNLLFHEIEISNDEKALKVGEKAQLLVNDEIRSANIRNHSATHLLNSTVRKVINRPTYQKSSNVTAKHGKIELAILGPKLNENDIIMLQENLRKIIQNSLEKKVQIVNSQELDGDVVMVPGEIYPETGIRVVSFGENYSKELCCGTHVFNTSELIEFVFLNVKSTSRTSYAFTFTTAQSAIYAIQKGDEILKNLKIINENISIDNFGDVLTKIRTIANVLSTSDDIAYLKKQECQRLVHEIKEKVKQTCRNVLAELLDVEMATVVAQNESNPFVIHFLSCSDLMKSVSLAKATRCVKDKPVLILSLTDGELKARCAIPQNLITENFNAKLWLSVVASVFKSKVDAPKGQDFREFCFMKGKKINQETFNTQLELATCKAKEFAEQKLQCKENVVLKN